MLRLLVDFKCPWSESVEYICRIWACSPLSRFTQTSDTHTRASPKSIALAFMLWLKKVKRHLNEL